jgi:hypothetical protein
MLAVGLLAISLGASCDKDGAAVARGQAAAEVVAAEHLTIKVLGMT